MKYEADRMDLLREGREEQEMKDDKETADSVAGVMKEWGVSVDEAMRIMRISDDKKQRIMPLMTE